MKKAFTILLLTSFLLVVGSFWALNSPSGNEISLAIYQQNLASITEIHDLEIPGGKSEKRIEDLPTQIIPESVRLETLEGPNTLKLLEQIFRYQPITEKSLLESHLGKEIEVIGQGSLGYKTYKGTLISISGGIILEDKSGQVIIIKDPVNISFPAIPEKLTKEPYLLWKLENSNEETGDYKVRMNYLSKGLDWDAHYLLVLSEDNKSDLSSWVSISNNSGKTFKDAAIELVAGKLHRVPGRQKAAFNVTGVFKAQAPETQFETGKVFEYHCYSLDRRLTLNVGQEKQLSFLSARDIQIDKAYTYEGQVQKGVSVSVNFENSKLNGLGKPLPAGIVRIYKEGEKGVRLIGEDNISHTPIDENVNLTLGTAFDLVGERKRTEHKRIGEDTYSDTFEVTLRNQKDEDVTIDVIEHLRGSWEVTYSYPNFRKLDSQRIAFKVSVKTGREAIIRYTVQYTL